MNFTDQEKYEIEVCYLLKYLSEIDFYDEKILASQSKIKNIVDEREKKFRANKSLNISLKNLYFRIGIALEAVLLLLISFINQKLFLKFPTSDLNIVLMHLFDAIVFSGSPFVLKCFYTRQTLKRNSLLTKAQDATKAEQSMIEELKFSIDNYTLRKEESIITYEEIAKTLKLMKKSVKMT